MRGARSIILACVGSLALAACGSSSPAATPLSSALSYFPRDSPFVMSLVTSPNAPAVKNAQAMLGRIPFATFGQAALISRLQQLGISYDTDIRPLFGNPVMVGLASSGGSNLRAFSTGNTSLLAWVTKDAGTLSSLVKKLHASSTGSHDGATFYRVSGTTLAVDGATLLVGSSQSLLTTALNRHAAGSGMTTAGFNADLGTLPSGALVRAAGDLAPLISSSSRTAVPWLAALRAYGVAVGTSSGGLTFQYTLDTSSAHLSSGELPLSPGTSPPGFVGTAPLQLGLREPAATLAFALDAERRSSPTQYAAVVARMNAVRRKTGVDFRRDVLDQLGANLALNSTPADRGLMARIDVRNPRAMARTLRKLGPSLLGVLGSHSQSTVTAGPAGFEIVHRGRNKILVGLVGSELVLGTGSPAALQAFGTAPAVAAPGAQGAFAFRVSLPEAIQLTQRGAPSKTIQAVLSALGDISGWLSSSSSALTGSATLGLK